MTIGLVANPKRGDGSELDFEYTSDETLHNITNSLEGAGARVIQIEANNDIQKRLTALADELDLAFNIAEGLPEWKDRKYHVPCILEGMCIPHTGSDSAAQHIAQDKSQTRLVLGGSVYQPEWQALDGPEPLIEIDDYPLFIKPSCEGSSMGISENCIVHSEEEMKEVVERMLSKYGAVIAEQFLGGSEYNMGVIGDVVLPALTWNLEDMPGGPKVKTRDTKDHCSGYVKKVDDDVRYMQLAMQAAAAHSGLKASDCSRSDFRSRRLDDGSDSGPHFLEINLLPSLAKGASLMRAADAAGIKYETVINCIVYSAMIRSMNNGRFVDRLKNIDTGGFVEAYKNSLAAGEYASFGFGDQQYRVLMPKAPERAAITC